WPTPGQRNLTAEAELDAARDLVVAVRRLRSDYKVDWSRRVPAILEADGRQAALQEQAAWIGALGRLEPLTIAARLDDAPRRALSVVAGGCRAYLPVEGLF